MREMNGAVLVEKECCRVGFRHFKEDFDMDV
jgi:hypothetical protein